MTNSSNENGENYRAILDSTGVAIFELDLQGICTFCNLACCKMLGYDLQEDLLGQPIHTLIHPHRGDGSPHPFEVSQIQNIKKEGTHVGSDALFRRDGSSFLAEYWSYPITREGKTAGCVVTFLDISEREQVEEELWKSYILFGQAEQMATYELRRHGPDTESLWNWNSVEYRQSSSRSAFTLPGQKCTRT